MRPLFIPAGLSPSPMSRRRVAPALIHKRIEVAGVESLENGFANFPRPFGNCFASRFSVRAAWNSRSPTHYGPTEG